MRIEFTKMQSLGNDFVVIDGVSQSIVLDASGAELIADRHKGIGCDQILLAESIDLDEIKRTGSDTDDDSADFRFRVFNADGSEVGQCGNGARCFLKFLLDRGLTSKRVVRVQTSTSAMTLSMNPDRTVSVDMGEPQFAPSQVPFVSDNQAIRYPLEIESGTISIGAVSMGNPHAVQVLDALTDDIVAQQGPQIEHHDRFPERTNVGFMQIVDRGHINLRVHERGVGETEACGSGACGAVAVGRIQSLLDETVEVMLPGGALTISWAGPGNSLTMTGPANTVFEGVIDVPGSA